MQDACCLFGCPLCTDKTLPATTETYNLLCNIFEYWISLTNQKELQIHQNYYPSKAELNPCYYNLNMFAIKYHHKGMSLV